jgi:hypothetical protein
MTSTQQALVRKRAVLLRQAAALTEQAKALQVVIDLGMFTANGQLDELAEPRPATARSTSHGRRRKRRRVVKAKSGLTISTRVMATMLASKEPLNYHQVANLVVNQDGRTKAKHLNVVGASLSYLHRQGKLTRVQTEAGFAYSVAQPQS